MPDRTGRRSGDMAERGEREVRACLEAYGVRGEIRTFEESTHNAELAARELQVGVGGSARGGSRPPPPPPPAATGRSPPRRARRTTCSKRPLENLPSSPGPRRRTSPKQRIPNHNPVRPHSPCPWVV